MAGQIQRAISVEVDRDGRGFAIYAGEGVYLRSLARTPDGRHSFGRDSARKLSRSGAVAALHIIRRAGRRVWIVPHPGSGVPA